MTKIAFIGAGSTVFTRNLIGDVLSLPELADTTTIESSPPYLAAFERKLRMTCST